LPPAEQSPKRPAPVPVSVPVVDDDHRVERLVLEGACDVRQRRVRVERRETVRHEGADIHRLLFERLNGYTWSRLTGSAAR
jgi:PII-like signaling protein